MHKPHLPGFLFAFANGQGGTASLPYIKGLKNESLAIGKIFDDADQKGLARYKHFPEANFSHIWECLTHPNWKHQVQVFHYGGHSEGDGLWFEHPSELNQKARTKALVSILGKQKGLNLIFLNSCYSAKIADKLLKKQVPIVIGSYDTLRDSLSTPFTKAFYLHLLAGDNVKTAFNQAKEILKSDFSRQLETWQERNAHRNNKKKTPKFPYVLKIHPDTRAHLDWKIVPAKAPKEPTPKGRSINIEGGSYFEKADHVNLSQHINLSPRKNRK